MKLEISTPSVCRTLAYFEKNLQTNPNASTFTIDYRIRDIIPQL
ncbi:hypothetical protein RRSWK_01388 [Rhodopirellula sp. SWK7]|nr:hypothetical protein RRSWK_01388 [Rhodopirellula sp. SWK7]